MIDRDDADRHTEVFGEAVAALLGTAVLSARDRGPPPAHGDNARAPLPDGSGARG